MAQWHRGLVQHPCAADLSVHVHVCLWVCRKRERLGTLQKRDPQAMLSGPAVRVEGRVQLRASRRLL